MAFHGRRIAQIMIAKEQSDSRLLMTDTSQWFTVDHSKISPLLSEKWHQFHMDEETEHFLERSFEISNSLCLQIYYAFASAILSVMMTKTSINGLLGRGSMFLFSSNQFKEFIRFPDDWNRSAKYMLDLGAGDGHVTSVLAEFYKNVAVTEASQMMQWRLSQQGYKILAIDEWSRLTEPLDLVSALNLLDRYYDPVVLLDDLYQLTSRTNALLLIAVVLPIRQYVEFHPSSKTTRPDSEILLDGETFEQQASSLIEKVFMPAGFELVRWGKLPYLCEGDHVRAYYKLDDAVFILRSNPLYRLNDEERRRNIWYKGKNSRNIEEL